MSCISKYHKKYQNIRFGRDEQGVLVVTLHTRGGPCKWGTAATSLHGELGPAFQDIANDAENRVVIITGTGDTFIAEFDRDDLYPEKEFAGMWERTYNEALPLLSNLLAIPVPVICAVNGPALIHSELAVCGDIVLAAEHTEFADLAHFCNGVVPGDGVQIIWPMLLGPNRARHFLLTGEYIGAKEALRLGVVNELLPNSQLLARALELASELAAKPDQVLRYTRSVLTRDLRRRVLDELANGLAHEGMALLSQYYAPGGRQADDE